MKPRRPVTQKVSRAFIQAITAASAKGFAFPHLRAFPVETGRLLASFFISGAL